MEKQIRQINLSYNNINSRRTIFKPKPKLNGVKAPKQSTQEDENFDLDYKHLFVKTLTDFIIESKCLNHLNLSGMGLETVSNKEMLLDLALALSNSNALESIHLSDN